MDARGKDAEEGVCPRYEFAKTIDGHADEVNCVLAGDSIICTGSDDTTIRVLCAYTQKLLFVLEGHKSYIRCLAFVHGTRFLASGGQDGSIIFFDLSTRKLAHSLTGGHSECVRCLLTIPGTSLLVSCSYDKTLKVWDVHTLRCLRTLAGHTKWVIALANVPGDLVASGSEDGSIKLWWPATGKCVRSIARAHDGPCGVMCVAFVPGLRLLASGGGDGRIKMWDVVTGNIKATFTDDDLTTCSIVRSIAIVPHTTLLASSGDDMVVKVWDGTTGMCVQNLAGHEGDVYGVDVDPSTRSILSVGDDKTLKVWIDPKGANACRRYCVLICLSILTAKLNSGEEYFSVDRDEDGVGVGGEGQGDESCHLQGVLAFDIIASADVWRHILEFL